MGKKLLWVGATCILAGDILPIPAIKLVGSIIMIMGCLLYVFDK